ncbi:MAG: CoA transferase [Mycobacterium sp.]
MAAEPLGSRQALSRARAMPALSGVRIVELAESVAGEYCGKLLADFGAEVIKVERPGTGSPTSATSLDVIADESLWARGAYRFVSDHLEGQRPVLGPSWRIARNPARIERGAPDLGEHNDYVFSELAMEPR